MFFIPRLVEKYADDWEKQFDFKRRASIESRRKLLSNTLSLDYGVEGGQIPRNSFYEIDVFPPPENDDPAKSGGVPLTQISVERPNFSRGRRRSLPALYISNTPSPHLDRNLPNKARLSPGVHKISRLSAELSSAGSADSPVFTPRTGNGTSLATEKPRPNRMRGRRGSLPAISLNKSNFHGNASRTTQLLLVDPHLLARKGIPLVSVSAPPKLNHNKRRGSLPAVNYPNLPTAAKPSLRPKPHALGRRRGSLPSITLEIPEGDNEQGLPSNSYPERKRLAKPSLLTLPSRLSREVSIKEQEEENQEGRKEIVGDNCRADKRLSTSSGYSTNGNVCGSVDSNASLGTEEKPNVWLPAAILSAAFSDNE